MSDRIKKLVSRFARDDKGDITLEAMIVLPALLVIFAATWVYFDVMRQHTINQKANYTIGDIVSRETEVLDDAYVDNARELLFHLAQAQGNDVDLRISVVQYVGDGVGQGSYQLIWSTSRGDWSALTQGDLVNYQNRLPILYSGDQTIVVETRDWYEPTLHLAGVDAFDISTYSFTRPRFAPQVIFEGINDGSGRTWFSNGWGNGDNDAPSGEIVVADGEGDGDDDGDGEGNGS
ncbi:TadE/TadG family type IV pilus assembly protein [Marivita sp.]|jgi:Flp pilus assembly protein TadG|uniref:TadE/TadG family type IV pilus assembly protein n=1 Tax=Marivita sp. TaxID=2003365 RepID=UPI003F6F8F15